MTERDLGVDECGTYHTKTPFNHDAEVKVVRPSSETDVQPTVVDMVEKAATNGDVAAMERIVYRARWDMDGNSRLV